MKHISGGLMAREGQDLANHSRNVSELASKFGKKNGMANIMHMAGLLHDLGKARPEFQAYLKDSVAGRDVRRGKVRHSIYGAKRAFVDLENAPLLAEILGNIIGAHHGALYDNLSPDGDTPLLDRLFETDLLPHMPGGPAADIHALEAEFKDIFDKIHDDDKLFGLTMLIKLAFSCLVDADRLDAYLHESNASHTEKLPNWGGMLAFLLEYLGGKAVTSEIAAFRQKVSDACGKAGPRNRGIYKLEVPTGGGKTLASLRFALTHAKEHGMDRIIYIIPYLSILSQTAKEIRK
ncbi:MAG: CRISPR-associated endonuclease Cas3'', partial [Clostridiales bacterium]|nr:CRISPR-associated endonuclease Cas3'' [Clostridiales bacterium]